MRSVRAVPVLFCLCFSSLGFVPGDNPGDKETISRDLPDMTAYHNELELRHRADICVCLTGAQSRVLETEGWLCCRDWNHRPLWLLALRWWRKLWLGRGL